MQVAILIISVVLSSASDASFCTSGNCEEENTGHVSLLQTRLTMDVQSAGEEHPAEEDAQPWGRQKEMKGKEAEEAKEVRCSKRAKAAKGGKGGKGCKEGEEAEEEEPIAAPIEAPTTAPTEAPTTALTEAPTTAPTEAPTTAPTEAPTTVPTEAAEYVLQQSDAYCSNRGGIGGSNEFSTNVGAQNLQACADYVKSIPECSVWFDYGNADGWCDCVKATTEWESCSRSSFVHYGVYTLH